MLLGLLSRLKIGVRIIRNVDWCLLCGQFTNNAALIVVSCITIDLNSN